MTYKTTKRFVDRFNALIELSQNLKIILILNIFPKNPFI